MADKLLYDTEEQRAAFIMKYSSLGIYDDFQNKIVYHLAPNEIIENGVPVLNPNYEKELEQKEINTEIQRLTEEIDELDLKRIRAVCEPSLKNEEKGETWLDYYNSQIQEKRLQIQELTERINNDITI